MDEKKSRIKKKVADEKKRVADEKKKFADEKKRVDVPSRPPYKQYKQKNSPQTYKTKSKFSLILA